MLEAYIDDLTLDLWHHKLQDVVLGDLGHALGELDAVFTPPSLLPLVLLDLADAMPHVHHHLIAHQRDDAASA